MVKIHNSMSSSEIDKADDLGLLQRFSDMRSELLPGKQELLELWLLPLFLKPKIRHIHGLSSISYGDDELIVVCVVKNGALYIKSFVEHYLSMGVNHLVFLDNGSTDNTLELLCAYDSCVTVLQTNAPYHTYENAMKRYLANRFSKGRWHLCADIDELFVYPCSSKISLNKFLKYLNENGFTAVIAHLLDLFSEVPMANLESNISDSLKDKYTYYDLSAITRSDDYWWSKPPMSYGLKAHWGGVRTVLFGTNNGLTKAPLVKMDGKAQPFVQWHHVRNARLADVSCVLQHYPFVSSFFTKVREAVETGCRGVFTDEYEAYWRELERNPNLNIKFETAQKFTGLDGLLEQGFIVASDQYRQWISDHADSPSISK